ncbi:MAG: aa3-type cytochrome c oxidase subunit IV [Sphingopyxis sp.]|jgi:hypothetical protein|nr:aa3-type cytochrome c oxidase subunit IV [Sphingopyxis sp.]
MAEHDIRDANKTYDGFIALTKWSTVACALVAVLVVILIS